MLITPHYCSLVYNLPTLASERYYLKPCFTKSFKGSLTSLVHLLSGESATSENCYLF